MTPAQHAVTGAVGIVMFDVDGVATTAGLGILVNDQDRARRFYTDVLGFRIQHDIPLGEAAWLTLVTPGDDEGVELLLEPAGHPAAAALQDALFRDRIRLAQLSTDDIVAEVERLRGRGVAFGDGIKTMGPTKSADFNDTCGNLIRLVEG
jgi:catechol 2,3-dioxygenase-like lactoylglutathione lyase family enzyme